MSVLDITTMFVLIVLMIVRVGLPILGICLLCKGLKRALPTQA
jgi:hypothetical protein